MSIASNQFGDAIELISGPAFKSKFFTDNQEDVPLVKGENIGKGQILWEKSKFWPRDDIDKYDRFWLEPGDVVLAMDRPWVSGGLKFAQINDHDPRSLLVQRVARIRPRTGHCADYIKYVVASGNFREYIRSIMGGVGVPHISADQIRRYEVTLPDLQTQDSIATTLSAYDDLIENNRRRIQLLEESARLLYKEWFVHLRFPGHEHTTITDGVPEGWAAKTVSDFYGTSSGGTPSRKKPEYFTGDIPWIKTQELPNGFVLKAMEHITEEAVSKSSAKIFPKKTLLLALYGATIGEIGILSESSACNQACCAIQPRENRAHYLYAYLFFRENKTNLVALSGGAAQNNISQKIVRSFPMTMPTATLISCFTEIVQPIFDQWLNLERQTFSLTRARDLLLPRLMSGEVAV
jgi:type I restriction enzyme, S subunit